MSISISFKEQIDLEDEYIKTFSYVLNITYR